MIYVFFTLTEKHKSVSYIEVQTSFIGWFMHLFLLYTEFKYKWLRRSSQNTLKTQYTNLFTEKYIYTAVFWLSIYFHH